MLLPIEPVATYFTYVSLMHRDVRIWRTTVGLLPSLYCFDCRLFERAQARDWNVGAPPSNVLERAVSVTLLRDHDQW